MTPVDTDYIDHLLKTSRLNGPVLELGAGIPEHSCRELVLQYSLEHTGTDIAGQADVFADFEDKSSVAAAFAGHRPFGSALILNVLEHCFDPVAILDNTISLLEPGGVCVVITPCIWPIHSFPVDCWRPLPDFYRRYAISRNLHLLEDEFRFLPYGRIADYTGQDGQVQYPLISSSASYMLYSRLIHRLFNTTGRGTRFPTHLAIGVIFIKQD